MSTDEAMVTGRVKPDGTLELDQKVPLPPGPVRVTVQAAVSPPGPEETWTALERIWEQRKALGIKGRTREEIDAQIDALRDESEEELREIERVHDRGRGDKE